MEALLAARGASVGNDDLAELLAQGPPPVPESERDRFWALMDDPMPATETASTLLAVLHHLSTFWTERDRPNVVLLHYADLKADLAGPDARAGRSGCRSPCRRSAGPNSSRPRPSRRCGATPSHLAPAATESIWRDDQNFFHRGTSGQWRDLFQDGDEARYDARVRELADPDLAAWAHHGSAVR